MIGELLLLRLVHVLGGTFWLGSGIFTTFFLFPALQPLGPVGGQVLANLTQRKLFAALPTAAILTMLSGARLMMITSAGQASYFGSTRGMTYSISATAAVVAFVLSLAVVRPAGVRMTTLTQQAAANPADRARLAPQLASLQGRVKTWSILAMMLLISAGAGMAVARYL